MDGSDGRWYLVSSPYSSEQVEYIRADIHQALVDALAGACDVIEEWYKTRPYQTASMPPLIYTPGREALAKLEETND